MIEINSAYIGYFTGLLTGGADDDDMVLKYWNIDCNDESTIKAIISEMIKPYYEGNYSAVFKFKAKTSLSYYLTTNRIDFSEEFNSKLIPFDHPDDAKLFYIWIWEVLFENEDYIIEDVSLYKEIQDYNEPLQYL
ncbi:hypothetical protein GCM10027037_26790 [Mucilaginibacter koreensis]